MLLSALVILPLFLIMCLPVSTMLLNEFRLWRFSSQLNELDNLFDGDLELIASGASVHQTGNDEACGFRATRVYRHHRSEKNLVPIREYLDGRVFAAARVRDDGSAAEKYIDFASLILVVTIQDGPYPAWFDIRCW